MDFSPMRQWTGGEALAGCGVANRIAELRAARGLTLEQLADRVGTSNQQIHRLERGQRRLTDDWMRRIAPALDVSPAELLPISDCEPKEIKEIEDALKRDRHFGSLMRDLTDEGRATLLEIVRGVLGLAAEISERHHGSAGLTRTKRRRG